MLRPNDGRAVESGSPEKKSRGVGMQKARAKGRRDVAGRVVGPR